MRDVETFFVSVELLPSADFNLNKGIFDPSSDNPFRNWSVIFVSYVTGDFHTGNGDFHYTTPDGSSEVVHHHGYRNYRKLIDELIKHVDSPEKLLITGGSAGAFGASALARDVISYFPECEDVTCCPDYSLIIYDNWQHVAKNVWHANEAIWKPLTGQNISLDWLRALYDERGDKVKYLYVCSTRVYLLATYQHYIDHGQLKITRTSTTVPK